MYASFFNLKICIISRIFIVLNNVLLKLSKNLIHLLISLCNNKSVWFWSYNKLYQFIWYSLFVDGVISVVYLIIVSSFKARGKILNIRWEFLILVGDEDRDGNGDEDLKINILWEWGRRWNGEWGTRMEMRSLTFFGPLSSLLFIH